MSASVDRTLVEQLLQDQNLSYRECARRASCSEWTVRKIARDLAGDARPMKHARSADEDEPTGFVAWLTFAGIIAAIVGAIWLATRRVPPESDSMP